MRRPTLVRARLIAIVVEVVHLLVAVNDGLWLARRGLDVIAVVIHILSDVTFLVRVDGGRRLVLHNDGVLVTISPAIAMVSMTLVRQRHRCAQQRGCSRHGYQQSNAL